MVGGVTRPSTWTVQVEELSRGGSPWRTVGPILGSLTGLLAVGTLGYVVVEGWSFLDAVFMALITLTTIGYGETRPLSDPGRVFTIVYILAGLALATRGLSELARYVSDGRLTSDVRVRRIRRELHAMRGHFIVVGYGRLGREIVADLLHHGVEVVVVDLVDGGSVPPGVHLLVGDASHDEVLVAAGVERARGMAVATASDALNVFVTLSARQLAPNLDIQTRVEDEGSATKARRAGATGIVLPYHLGGSRVAQMLLRPGSSAFVEHATQRQFSDLHLEDVRLEEGCEVRGTLREIDLRSRYGVIVVAIQRKGASDLIYPHADTPVGPGDTLVVVGPPSNVREFVETLC